MTDITPARLRDLAAKHEWHAHGGPDNTAAALRAAADRIEQCVGVVGDLEEREQELLATLAAREALLKRAGDALEPLRKTAEDALYYCADDAPVDHEVYVELGAMTLGELSGVRALAAEIAEVLKGAPDAPP
jgi:hypothetical protein